MILATIVDAGDLLGTIVASIVAGVGVTLSFSLAIFGAARMADARAADRPLHAAGAGVLMAAGIVVTLGGIGLGIGVMIGG